MKKTLLSFVAVASIAVAMGGPQASAQEITIKKGDTLWGISNKYDTSVDHIKELNNLDSDIIIENTKLIVKEDQPKTYTVKKGDSLWKIAVKNKISINQLKSWNSLNSEIIQPGQVLNLSGVGQPAKNNTEAVQQKTTTTSTTTKTETKTETTTTTAKSTGQKAGKTLSVSATAYTASCNGCSGVTATGVDLNANPNAKVIAVDPSVIPLGSKVYVEGYGYATAADTGGAIKGNKIDVFIPTQDAALNWGRKQVNIQILN
ncbi:LysM peptidoglycan-binding domain-containing protein [Pradoshia sp. D12]|uniref:3D domain-containing protein n=1 Tax=Pradoshia sp. D12 TaxID=2651284 RepID=UPI00080ACA6A|nr:MULTISPECIES: 3D domain-containing protein [Bacillaceae]OCA89529.1 peptidoglycan-binding protein [Bacillus sp. FJAT-27986]QFK71091.1 LysM peptidoglycan-binding domain-containing protein [Pradoshia sp. D12]TPF72883.1 LysM peptidoglycan-binding domain-containing protein [Bacillus sp. D12]